MIILYTVIINKSFIILGSMSLYCNYIINLSLFLIRHSTYTGDTATVEEECSLCHTDLSPVFLWRLGMPSQKGCI